MAQQKGRPGFCIHLAGLIGFVPAATPKDAEGGNKGNKGVNAIILDGQYSNQCSGMALERHYPQITVPIFKIIDDKTALIASWTSDPDSITPGAGKEDLHGSWDLSGKSIHVVGAPGNVSITQPEAFLSMGECGTQGRIAAKYASAPPCPLPGEQLHPVSSVVRLTMGTLAPLLVDDFKLGDIDKPGLAVAASWEAPTKTHVLRINSLVNGKTTCEIAFSTQSLTKTTTQRNEMMVTAWIYDMCHCRVPATVGGTRQPLNHFAALYDLLEPEDQPAGENRIVPHSKTRPMVGPLIRCSPLATFKA